jgi:hypothetical protein
VFNYYPEQETTVIFGCVGEITVYCKIFKFGNAGKVSVLCKYLEKRKNGGKSVPNINISGATFEMTRQKHMQVLARNATFVRY